MNINHCKTFTAPGSYLKEQAARPDLTQAECKQLYISIEEHCRHHYLDAMLSGHPSWYICESTAAVHTYLYRNWRYQKSLKANRAYLFRIADHIQQAYFCADEPQITVQEAMNIFSTIDNYYGFSEKILGSAPLILLLPNDAHRTYDALFRPYSSPDGQVNGDIIMPHIQQDTKTNPGSMLLHELGHLLNIKLTRDLLILPDFFVELNHLMRSSHIESTPEQLSELFAHLFAMTMLQLPELKEYDSYSPLPEKVMAIFSAYFQTVFKNL